MVGRSIARRMRSGTFVGPGICKKWRPRRTIVPPQESATARCTTGDDVTRGVRRANQKARRDCGWAAGWLLANPGPNRSPFLRFLVQCLGDGVELRAQLFHALLEVSRRHPRRLSPRRPETHELRR